MIRKWAILRGKKNNLVKDLNETTLTLEKLGKKYRVSRQAIYDFSKRHGIRRPVKPKGHQTEGCRLCQKLIQIAKRFHGEFISNHTIVKKIGVSRGKYHYHLRILRARGLVSQTFGRLLSRRVERAYAIYFTKRLSMRKIGRKVGLRNFPSIIRQHRELGWNVPPSLYVYDGRERSKILRGMHQREKR